MQNLKKAVRFFHQHGPGFVLRKALWRFEFEGFRRQLARRDARFGPRTPTVRFLGQEFELHPSGEGLSAEITLFGAYEPVATRIYRQHLREGDHVLDVGSNLGYYALMAGRAVGVTGQVLGFEPASDVYPILERNVARSGLANIRVFPWAIGARNDATEFYESDVPNWGSLIRKERLSQVRTATVPIRKLDDILDQFPEFHPNALRMDVEGGELMVLEGAWKILRKYRPRVFVEIHTFAFPWQRAREAILGLRELGYSSGVLIDRLWDCPWASRWMRERRYWSEPVDKLLARIESRKNGMASSYVFSLLLKATV